MKSLIGLALLICFIVPFYGAWQFLTLQIHHVKRSATQLLEAGIDKEAQVLLKFTEAESTTLLQWEHAKEFEYKGEMYDIICTEIVSDTIWYWCHHDHKETSVRKDRQVLVLHAFGHTPQGDEKQNYVFRFFKNLYLDCYMQLQEILSVICNEQTNYCFSAITCIQDPPFLPPKYC